MTTTTKKIKYDNRVPPGRMYLMKEEVYTKQKKSTENEYRCIKCGKMLLKKTFGSGIIEVKCPRCREYNYIVI